MSTQQVHAKTNGFLFLGGGSVKNTTSDHHFMPKTYCCAIKSYLSMKIHNLGRETKERKFSLNGKWPNFILTMEQHSLYTTLKVQSRVSYISGSPQEGLSRCPHGPLVGQPWSRWRVFDGVSQGATQWPQCAGLTTGAQGVGRTLCTAHGVQLRLAATPTATSSLVISISVSPLRKNGLLIQPEVCMVNSAACWHRLWPQVIITLPDNHSNDLQLSHHYGMYKSSQAQREES